MYSILNNLEWMQFSHETILDFIRITLKTVFNTTTLFMVYYVCMYERHKLKNFRTDFCPIFDKRLCNSWWRNMLSVKRITADAKLILTESNTFCISFITISTQFMYYLMDVLVQVWRMLVAGRVVCTGVAPRRAGSPRSCICKASDLWTLSL